MDNFGDLMKILRMWPLALEYKIHYYLVGDKVIHNSKNLNVGH